MPFFKKNSPEPMQDMGWQFYSRPTTMEPPGTVFRLDKEGKRFIVDYLEVKTKKGDEGEACITRTIETTGGILARFLGIIDVKIGAEKHFQLKYSLSKPFKESTTDFEMDKELKPFLKKLSYRVDNRYYVVRDTRSAIAMKFLLSEEQVTYLGGESVLSENLKVGGNISRQKSGIFEINQEFEKPMHVLFLPDEIVPISVRLAGGSPELGTRKVEEVLVWEDDKDP